VNLSLSYLRVLDLPFLSGRNQSHRIRSSQPCYHDWYTKHIPNHTQLGQKAIVPLLLDFTESYAFFQWFVGVRRFESLRLATSGSFSVTGAIGKRVGRFGSPVCQELQGNTRFRLRHSSSAG
jgi:hypothetical protein